MRRRPSATWTTRPQYFRQLNREDVEIGERQLTLRLHDDIQRLQLRGDLAELLPHQSFESISVDSARQGLSADHYP